MQRGLGGGTVFEPVQEPIRRDRELTLGPATLAAIGLALFGLCAGCFLFGYSIGHHAAESGTSLPLPLSGATTASQSALQSKPSARPVTASPQLEDTVSDQPEIADADSSPAQSSVSAPVSSSPGAAATSSTEPPVHAALAAQPVTSQSAPGSARMEPALAQTSGVMVQIAAVSHAEDADVLVGALRKRGYAVTARRDPADGLLHVEVGPFANRSDAYAMRQKLLNDGYNAVVQQ